MQIVSWMLCYLGAEDAVSITRRLTPMTTSVPDVANGFGLEEDDSEEQGEHNYG
jgi:hypothetical protein